MEQMPDYLKQLLEHIHMVEMNFSDKGTWVNVQQLRPEDILKKKEMDMRRRQMWSKAKVLASKLQVIQATLQAEQDEFWDGIYATYNIPANLPYRVSDEGMVIKYVPAPAAENP